MKEFIEYHRSITKKSLLAGAIIVLVSFAVDPSYGLGFFLGCAASVLVFRLKVRHYMKFASLSKKKAAAFIMQRNFLRFLILGAFLAVAFYNEKVSGFAAAAGLFLTNGVIIVDQIVTYKLSRAGQ